MTILQSIMLGAIQGFAEFLPIEAAFSIHNRKAIA